MPEKPFISQRGQDLIKTFLLGGGLVGGGTAAAVSLINYLKHLSKNKSDQDDDTMYVYRDREQVKAANLGTGIALAGGVASMAGAYALVRKIYQSLRLRAAQKELDDAQNAFLDVQGYKQIDKKDLKKEAAEGHFPGFAETLMSSPIAASLLLALASGATGYAILDNQYPARKPEVKGPKRIEIVDKPEEDKVEKIVDEQAEIAKSACMEDATELLMHVIGTTKTASVSDIRNAVAACAAGDASSFKNLVKEAGFVGALDSVKGAADYRQASPLREQMAISFLAKSAATKSMTGLIAAGEFATAFPEFYKAACCLPADTRETLVKIAGILGAAIRAELSYEAGVRPAEDMEKSSSLLTETVEIGGSEKVAGLLETILSQKPVDDGETESSDISTVENGTPEEGAISTPKFTHGIKTTKMTVGEKMDEIDNFLTPHEGDQGFSEDASDASSSSREL